MHFIDHTLREETILAANSGCFLFNTVLVLVENSKDFMWKYSYISLTDWHQDINWKNYVNKPVISKEVNK